MKIINIIKGPPDTLDPPIKSLGILFYNELKSRDPSKVIFIDHESGNEITNNLLLKSSIKLAVALTKMGIKKDDTISIVSENSSQYIVVLLSALYLGVKTNAINPDYKPDEYKHILGICQPHIIFCSQKSICNLSKGKNANSMLVLFEDANPNGIKNLNNLLNDVNTEDLEYLNFQPVELDPNEQVALILTSSGTTGLPKAVMITHSNIRITLIYSRDPCILNMSSNERTILYLPFFHMFGTLMLISTLWCETKSVIVRKFVPQQFLKIIEDYQITLLAAVPPILLFLIKNPLVQAYNLQSLTDIFCGAGSPGNDLEEQVSKRFNLCFRQLYGMTETSGVLTIVPRGVTKIGSVGKLVNANQIKVCDKYGNAVGPNVIGEICLKGTSIIKGYYKNKEATRDAFDQDGFLKTGDLGSYDEHEFVYLVGRIKDIITYKGFQVSPAELEALLLKHPAVKDAGVVGMPNERTGEVPRAFIVKEEQSDDVTAEEIMQYIKDNICEQKCLHGGVRFVKEIPKNSAGKILRKQLRGEN